MRVAGLDAMANDNVASSPRRGLSRRGFLIGSGFSIAVLACGGDDAPATPDGATGENHAPVWVQIPDQSWVVGVPVSFDLRAYCSDPDADALSFTLEGTLPEGLSLVDGVITGTPTAATPSTAFTATADDGRA